MLLADLVAVVRNPFGLCARRGAGRTALDPPPHVPPEAINAPSSASRVYPAPVAGLRSAVRRCGGVVFRCRHDIRSFGVSAASAASITCRYAAGVDRGQQRPVTSQRRSGRRGRCRPPASANFAIEADGSIPASATWLHRFHHRGGLHRYYTATSLLDRWRWSISVINASGQGRWCGSDTQCPK